jgi:hypothetical protein
VQQALFLNKKPRLSGAFLLSLAWLLAAEDRADGDPEL